MKKINLSDCAHCALRRENRICLTPSGKASKGCPTASGKKKQQKQMPFTKFLKSRNLPGRHPYRKASVTRRATRNGT